MVFEAMAGEWSVDVSGLTVHLVKLMGVAGKRQRPGHIILKPLAIDDRVMAL